jgi:hypothetical protein
MSTRLMGDNTFKQAYRMTDTYRIARSGGKLAAEFCQGDKCHFPCHKILVTNVTLADMTAAGVNLWQFGKPANYIQECVQ